MTPGRGIVLDANILIRAALVQYKLAEEGR
jgi:hypothetical protein